MQTAAHLKRQHYFDPAESLVDMLDEVADVERGIRLRIGEPAAGADAQCHSTMDPPAASRWPLECPASASTEADPFMGGWDCIKKALFKDSSKIKSLWANLVAPGTTDVRQRANGISIR